MNLLFYDGSCGLCDHAVQFVLEHDSEKTFIFAPLQGKTALKILYPPPAEDSLVMIENYGTSQQKTYLLGEGAFRILWLLGGPWKLVGWISFLPPCLYNWGYRLVAKNRLRFFKKSTCALPDPRQQERFLP